MCFLHSSFIYVSTVEKQPKKTYIQVYSKILCIAYYSCVHSNFIEMYLFDFWRDVYPVVSHCKDCINKVFLRGDLTWSLSTIPICTAWWEANINMAHVYWVYFCFFCCMSPCRNVRLLEVMPARWWPNCCPIPRPRSRWWRQWFNMIYNTSVYSSKGSNITFF